MMTKVILLILMNVLLSLGTQTTDKKIHSATVFQRCSPIPSCEGAGIEHKLEDIRRVDDTKAMVEGRAILSSAYQDIKIILEGKEVSYTFEKVKRIEFRNNGKIYLTQSNEVTVEAMLGKQGGANWGFGGYISGSRGFGSQSFIPTSLIWAIEFHHKAEAK